MLVHDLLASTNASNEEERANAKQRVSTPLHSSQLVKRSPAGACPRKRGNSDGSRGSGSKMEPTGPRKKRSGFENRYFGSKSRCDDF